MQTTKFSELALKAGVQVDKRLRGVPYDPTPVVDLAHELLAMDVIGLMQIVFLKGLTEAMASFHPSPILKVGQLEDALKTAASSLSGFEYREAVPQDLALCLALYETAASAGRSEIDAVGFAA